MITAQAPIVRGRKLVVQLVETFHKGGEPAIVESLDAVAVGKQSRMPIAPVMIYGDDVSHVVTEEGIAYLYKARGAGGAPRGARGHRRGHGDRPARRAAAHRGAARAAASWPTRRISASAAPRRSRTLLAARSIDDLVAWSGGLYRPPARFRGW